MVGPPPLSVSGLTVQVGELPVRWIPRLQEPRLLWLAELGQLLFGLGDPFEIGRLGETGLYAGEKRVFGVQQVVEVGAICREQFAGRSPIGPPQSMPLLLRSLESWASAVRHRSWAALISSRRYRGIAA